MYELGLAHAVQKPVVPIVQSVEDLPFDMRHLRHIVYSTKKIGWEEYLRGRIEKTIRATMEDPANSLAF
jgi:hypothetical protein